MPKTILRLVLLMLIMLNHAVSACESIVMHLPAEDHPFSVLDKADPAGHQHCSVQTTEEAREHSDDHQHPTHAHVACYIAQPYSVSAIPAVHKASAVAQYALITTIYSPPVPPPNPLSFS